MHIMILGSNSISIALAEILCASNHDVTLVSEDSQILKSLEQKIDIKTITGKPCYPQTLHQAQAQSTDILIAATNNDEINITACQIAYSLFAVPKKIAIIKASNYFANQHLFTNENIPIDIAINTNQLIANAALNIIQPLKQKTFLPSTDLQVIETTVSNLPKQGHLTYVELSDHYNVAIPPIYQTQEASIKTQDKIIIIGNPTNVQAAMTELTQADNVKKRIIIAGGSPISKSLATMCSHNNNIIIIDNCEKTCQRLANQLPETTIIHGNPNDDNLLKQINISSADIFLAFTEDDEDNILASLQAKQLGAKSTSTIIRKNNYLSILDQKIIDNILFPKNIIKQFITPLTRDTILKHSFLTSFENIEILTLSKKDLPKNFILKNKNLILASIKNHQLILAHKADCLENFDQIIMLIPNEKTLLEVTKSLKN